MIQNRTEQNNNNRSIGYNYTYSGWEYEGCSEKNDQSNFTGNFFLNKKKTKKQTTTTTKNDNNNNTETNKNKIKQNKLRDIVQRTA